MSRFALPAVLGFDLFRQADADTLLSIYRELFFRIATCEKELFIFAEGGFRPGEVLGEMDAALQRWPSPASRPPLFGVPVGIKDVFRTSGYAIRCGSLLPSCHHQTAPPATLPSSSAMNQPFCQKGVRS